MKRISIITLAAICIVALGAGHAMAASYDVTSNFGIRVTEQGPSEQIGSITITPAVPAASNVFSTGQIITVELLGNATISNSVAVDYDFVAGFDPTVAVDWGVPGDADLNDILAVIGGAAIPNPGYRLIAVEGNDFFTIEVNGNSPDKMAVGQDDASRICFDLEVTIYNSTDPARQLVQVSYADNFSNTFTGDIYVATVKSKSVTVENCAKSNAITLSFSDQDETCGVNSSGSICVEISDTSTGAFTAGNTYHMSIGKEEGAKAGVGFGDFNYWYKLDSGGAPILPGPSVGNVTRYNRLGDEISSSDFDTIEELYANTARLEWDTTFTAPSAGPGTYVLNIDVSYDTCTATPGDWLVDIMANKLPCGNSWSELDLNVAQFKLPSFVEEVFPYAAASAGGWFNGLVITNPNSTPLLVSFVIYEADGDMYTGSTTVAANGMAVGFFEDLVNPTTAGPDEAFGDESYNFRATASGEFYGFLFIGNGTMAQGYLPEPPWKFRP